MTSVAVSPDSQYIVSGCSDRSVRLLRSQWKTLLDVCCDRLRYHPVFTNSESIEDIEQRKIAIAACETCRKYVWSKEDISVYAMKYRQFTRLSAKEGRQSR
ncbi:hypothetical protein H6S82_05150 [Planktothrix sp. FACHB-1355]|uniref:Uncharacterized protein n=1 Tax=Aerosakkonema funiforme FACHB-1375 TaxID=2949571 RepID=A0A926ZK00_9CYAN|nr:MULTISPECIES: WD40 repeat domain-containing protein [Oscillatoriales]MBD2186113.1 hypothetical protein [Aerosakkonema funiforme FACHB-1375]MBD3558242.1 hypothetical protein [Planktothrix sp. FACHB-1355]